MIRTQGTLSDWGISKIDGIHKDKGVLELFLLYKGGPVRDYCRRKLILASKNLGLKHIPCNMDVMTRSNGYFRY
jgi:hypothetical protein